jgi:hypothetical protein
MPIVPGQRVRGCCVGAYRRLRASRSVVTCRIANITKERLKEVSRRTAPWESQSPVGTTSPTTLATRAACWPYAQPHRAPTESCPDLFRTVSKKPRQVFHLNIEKAARVLGIGMTKLKEHCRTLGISRWPSRKLKSMDKLIESLEERAAQDTDGQLVRGCGLPRVCGEAGAP